jgi:hypothetical protein
MVRKHVQGIAFARQSKHYRVFRSHYVRFSTIPNGRGSVQRGRTRRPAPPSFCVVSSAASTDPRICIWRSHPNAGLGSPIHDLPATKDPESDHTDGDGDGDEEGGATANGYGVDATDMDVEEGKCKSEGEGGSSFLRSTHRVSLPPRRACKSC